MMAGSNLQTFAANGQNAAHGFCHNHYKAHADRNGQIHHNIRGGAENGLFDEVQCCQKDTADHTYLDFFPHDPQNISGANVPQGHPTNDGSRGLGTGIAARYLSEPG